jgi:hypothetical protein
MMLAVAPAVDAADVVQNMTASRRIQSGVPRRMILFFKL